MQYTSPILIIAGFIEQLLFWYSIAVVAAVVMTWLVQFGVVNTYNRYARTIMQFLYSITEPVFAQVRRVMPPLGGLDLSPLIVLLVLQLLTSSVVPYIRDLLLR